MYTHVKHGNVNDATYSNVSTQLIMIFDQIYSTYPFVSNINSKYDNLITIWAQYSAVPL